MGLRQLSFHQTLLPGKDRRAFSFLHFKQQKGGNRIMILLPPFCCLIYFMGQLNSCNVATWLLPLLLLFLVVAPLSTVQVTVVPLTPTNLAVFKTSLMMT